MSRRVTTTTTTTVVEEPAKPATKKTYLAIVLDESGSMELVKNDTIGGFNSLIKDITELGELGGKTYVSLFTFGGGVRVPLMLSGTENLERLDEKRYRPSGGTPMLDAIGMALESLERYDNTEDDVAFKVTILTDGEENSSHSYDGPQISQMIKRLEKTGRWTIEMVGANVDIERLKRQTGINQTYSYVSSNVGTQNVFDSMRYGTQSYFAGRSMGMDAGQLNTFRNASAAAGTIDASSPIMVETMKQQAEEQLEKAKQKKLTFEQKTGKGGKKTLV